MLLRVTFCSVSSSAHHCSQNLMLIWDGDGSFGLNFYCACGGSSPSIWIRTREFRALHLLNQCSFPSFLCYLYPGASSIANWCDEQLKWKGACQDWFLGIFSLFFAWTDCRPFPPFSIRWFQRLNCLNFQRWFYWFGFQWLGQIKALMKAGFAQSNA